MKWTRYSKKFQNIQKYKYYTLKINIIIHKGFNKYIYGFFSIIFFNTMTAPFIDNFLKPNLKTYLSQNFEQEKNYVLSAFLQRRHRT